MKYFIIRLLLKLIYFLLRLIGLLGWAIIETNDKGHVILICSEKVKDAKYLYDFMEKRSREKYFEKCLKSMR